MTTTKDEPRDATQQTLHEAADNKALIIKAPVQKLYTKPC